jgi:hypothetical protein
MRLLSAAVHGCGTRANPRPMRTVLPALTAPASVQRRDRHVPDGSCARVANRGRMSPCPRRVGSPPWFSSC